MYNIKLLNKISNVGLAKFDTKEFASTGLLTRINMYIITAA